MNAAVADTAAPVEVPAGPTWFGQPRGLTVLFLTQMWEEFSFFGMRALLVYYMTKQLMIGQGKASLIYGAYAALAYFTPIIGGAISDRWLGRKRAVILGGATMAAGHFMMAFPDLFYPALITIALGNGLFLPSLPSQIGSLYADRDPRRGSAYNVYYVGINIGAFLAPLVCGTVGELYGWHWGFTLAGLGMVAGLAIYLAGARYLPPEPVRPIRTKAARAEAALVPKQDLKSTALLLLAVGLMVMVFRGAYEQVGNTIAVWTDSQVDRVVTPGLSVPMTWFQSLNPMLVFLLTPFFVARWTRQAKRGREPSPLVKMAMGAGGVASAYGLLAVVCALAGGGPVHWGWLAAFFVLLTAGELYILPIGLGLFARLAPASLAATTVAAWYLAAFAGNLLAGALGSFWSHTAPAVFFALMAAVATTAGLLLLLLNGPARRVEATRAAAPPIPLAVD
ncbi:POT family proton-dependent oligopeptide transporter [Caulobacter ginsengisoli]|uniref:POT family proton-dependent oligopeptide transporter n=1 Tax=Caulobacter ginsengisoli TaxID=400775 RepID=A0ABU0IKX7_9CAUL|nr:peptide MFS transporter [Caulobacter ginsengisoli]MDQ0462666.1 POT family proton-dependent oligopeptide transporter [Caulobacter ginsengisoli]